MLNTTYQSSTIVIIGSRSRSYVPRSNRRAALYQIGYYTDRKEIGALAARVLANVLGINASIRGEWATSIGSLMYAGNLRYPPKVQVSDKIIRTTFESIKAEPMGSIAVEILNTVAKNVCDSIDIVVENGGASRLINYLNQNCEYGLLLDVSGSLSKAATSSSGHLDIVMEAGT